MSLKIYLDDCANAKELVRLLSAAGHDVQVPQQAGIAGVEDEVHLRHAIRETRILLTKNPADFFDLHERHPEHAGILVIYQDNDPSRDMANHEIVKAIANLEAAGVPLEKSCHTLNAWRY